MSELCCETIIAGGSDAGNGGAGACAPGLTRRSHLDGRSAFADLEHQDAHPQSVALVERVEFVVRSLVLRSRHEAGLTHRSGEHRTRLGQRHGRDDGHGGAVDARLGGVR